MTFSPRRGSMGFARSTTLACVVNVVVRSLGPCSSSPLSPTLCALSLPLYTHTHTHRGRKVSQKQKHIEGLRGFWGLVYLFVIGLKEFWVLILFKEGMGMEEYKIVAVFIYSSYGIEKGSDRQF